jgi:hypothetical protein
MRVCTGPHLIWSATVSDLDFGDEGLYEYAHAHGRDITGRLNLSRISWTSEWSSDDDNDFIDLKGQGTPRSGLDMYRTESCADLVKDPAFKESKKSRYISRLSGVPEIDIHTPVGELPDDPQSRTPNTLDDRDRSFLTINTGAVVDMEITPFLVDALHSTRSEFAFDVSCNVWLNAQDTC